MRIIIEAYKDLWREDKVRFWGTVAPTIIGLISIVIAVVGILSR